MMYGGYIIHHRGRSSRPVYLREFHGISKPKAVISFEINEKHTLDAKVTPTLLEKSIFQSFPHSVQGYSSTSWMNHTPGKRSMTDDRLLKVGDGNTKVVREHYFEVALALVTAGTAVKHREAKIFWPL